MEYSENFEKLRLSDRMYDSLTEQHQPYVATFELLPSCNFKCIHCYLGVHRQEDKALTYDEIIYIIDELKKAGVIQIALTGGECTLRKDFVEIYEYVKKSGFVVTVFTNASNISEKLLECFKKYPPFSVEISLYGASEETYEVITGCRMYNRVITNIEKLYNEGINISIKTPLMKQNVKDEDELRKIANRYNKELRVGMALSPTIDKELYPVDFAIDLKDRFLYEVSSNPKRDLNVDIEDTINPYANIKDKNAFLPLFICNPGVSDVFVDFKGNVCPCIGYRSKGLSLLNNDFNSIWKEFAVIKKIPAPKEYKCIRCDCRYFCPICVGEQEETFGNCCHIPKDVCIYSHARKKYYIDNESVENILEFIENNI